MVWAYPGQMTQDSFDHIRESRDGIYSDAHPPIMNVLFKVCDALLPGQTGVLIVQSLLLLVGLYAIFRLTFTPRRAAWWTFGLYLFPPVFTVMSVIWKDCTMAGLLALGIAGLLSQKRSRRLWALAALTGATAFRYNAFGATLPLIVLLYQWRDGMPWLKRYAISTAAWLATTFAAFTINGAITDKPMHYWQSSLALYDIVGTYAYLDEDLPDEQIKADLAGTDLLTQDHIHNTMRIVYTTGTFYPIINDAKHTMWNVPINGYEPAPEAQRDAITHAWWHVVSTYPIAYVKHRLSVFGDTLAIGHAGGIGVPVPREIRDLPFAQKLGLATGSSWIQRRLTRWLQWFCHRTPFCLPWLYGLLSLVMLPLAFRHRDVLAILLSGLIMELTLLPLVHSNDYRYSQWMVITTTLAAVILATRRYRTARPAPADD